MKNFRHFSFVTKLSGISCLIFAMARPQIPIEAHSETELYKEGIDIVISMDASGSMLAKDFYPNRFEASKDLAKEFIKDKTFMLTYGDGVCDVNIKKLAEFHKVNNSKVTMTAVQPAGRFGALDINSNLVNEFVEKPAGDGNWINGGFMVCEPEVLDLIESDSTVFEKDPLQTLAKDGELSAFKHDGFWQCMDTLRDKTALNKLWDENQAPWKIW